MQKYAHVGYAKAASTWLQVELFPRHPDLCHLGRHNGDDIVDEDLRIALWNDLLTRPSFLYRAEETAATFQRLFGEAEARGAVACGVSQEMLTYAHLGTLDIAERARRLRGAMGDGTRVIIVVRNQLTWVRSLYSSLLKEGGATIGWDEFLFYFYYQQDYSPFSTLFYDDVWALYVDLFGEPNVRVVPFELIKRDARLFAAEICRCIGVSPLPELRTENVNLGAGPEVLTACLAYNREHRFYYGSHHFRMPWAYAAAPMYRKRFGVEPPPWVAQERERSRFLFESIDALVQEATRKGERIPPMDTSLPRGYETLLAKAYAPHNQRFMKLTGIDLKGLGYPVGG